MALGAAGCAGGDEKVESGGVQTGGESTDTTVELALPLAVTVSPTTVAPTPATTAARAATTVRAPVPTTARVYYANCTAARTAGAAPVRAGQPGYGSHLDRDGDGVGCES